MSRNRRIVGSAAGRSHTAPRAGLSRRQFLGGVAATTGALMLGGCGADTALSPSTDPELQPLPDPADSGIEHVVVVMMENRSFDHFLGWVPGADGKQAGLQFRDKQGQLHPTFPLAPNFQNCQFDDPDHSYDGARIEFDNGKNDGFLLAETNDLFPIGYYTRQDLSFFGGAVPAWTTFDRYFCAILGPTFPNRFYMHAAQTDRLENTLTPATIPTIWDRLVAAGLTSQYYYTDLPILALWGERFGSITRNIREFFTAAAAGALPSVCYIDPKFAGDGSAGTSEDDHPLADIRNGQAFLSRIYDAVTTSPNWPNTVLIINYDEWGGFYDHVPPPLAPQTALDPTIGNDGRLGFRVPCMVASPLARRGFIEHQQYDHTSILRMIEWRWGLEPLTIRDGSAHNIAHALDFTRPKNLTVPKFDVPQGPFGGSCHARATMARPELAGLREMAADYGFAVK
jgi:phospholipase C